MSVDELNQKNNPPLPPGTKRKRPTIAEVREKEREACRRELEILVKNEEREVVSEVALLALGSFCGVDDVNQLVAAIEKRQKAEYVSGFIAALRGMDAPMYLTSAMTNKSIDEAHGLLALFRATVSDTNKQWEDKITKAAREAEKAKSEEESGELTDEERLLCLGVRAVGHDFTGPIEAIKAVRARTGLGLKEAEDMVDAYRQKNGITG